MRRQRSWLWNAFLFGFLAVSIGSSGCAALLIGGAVAGGAAGYAYYQGNVHRDFPTDIKTTWSAANGALGDLSLPVVGQRSTPTNAELESRTADGHKITIVLEHSPYLAGPQTRVHVRIGAFGDSQLSARIHDQIAARLRGQPPTVTAPNSALVPAQFLPKANTEEPPLAEAAKTNNDE